MTTDATCVLNHHENSLAFSPVSPQWRKLRKICNSLVFSTSRLDASESLRSNEVKDLLSYVNRNSDTGLPIDVSQAAFTTTLNMLWNLFFSEGLGDRDSKFTHEIKDMLRGLMGELGKPNVADCFPLLSKIDPQGIKRRISAHLQKMIHVFDTIIRQRLQDKIPSCSPQGNDVLDALLGINLQKIEDNIIPSQVPNLLVELFVAGTVTTSSTLEWAMVELIRNPEILKRAREELHEIIEKGNLVGKSYIVKLPYLQAILKETLRLHPSVPFLIPRKLNTDVQLCGYNLPKNALVLVNAWAIGRDPDTWKNPNSFEPERFMDSKIDIKGGDFELIPFGAGRRMCPGLPLAMRMLHLMLASLIHGFDWKLEDGMKPETMDMDEGSGLTLEKAQRLRAIPVRV